MAKVSLVKSNKSKDMLCVDGYFFYLERSTKKTYNWACSKRIQKKCCSRLVTTLIENVHTITKYSKDHSHEPFPDEVNVVKANNLVKKLAKSSLLTTSQIIQKSVVETVPVSRDYLPTKSVQKQKINRIKRAKVGLREPNSIEEIDIPLSLYVLENELFILSEKYFHNECMIICGTKSSLQLLDESDCWIMDRTFDVVPIFMRQLFSIHGRVEGQIIPLVFCIMSRKSLTSYETFFIELIELARGCGIQLNPKRILSDFEIGIISAAKKYFPDTRLQGCFFHFSQIIWRKIQKERLVQKYGNDSYFSLHIRMLKALAFLPHDEVSEYYNQFYSTLEDEDIKQLCSWFERNYIARDNSQPKYPPKFWPVHKESNIAFPRTQNSIEAWHRRLKVIVGKRNSGLYKLINDLKGELVCAKAQLAKIQNGHKISQTKKAVKANNRIKRITKKKAYIKACFFSKANC